MSQYIKGREFAVNIALVQIVVTLVLSAVGFVANWQAAASLLSGGSISVLATTWLAAMAFRPPLGASPQHIVASFHVGALGKFVITAVMFVLAFLQLEFLQEFHNAALMITAYAVVQTVSWIYPLVRR